MQLARLAPTVSFVVAILVAGCGGPAYDPGPIQPPGALAAGDVVILEMQGDVRADGAPAEPHCNEAAGAGIAPGLQSIWMPADEAAAAGRGWWLVVWDHIDYIAADGTCASEPALSVWSKKASTYAWPRGSGAGFTTQLTAAGQGVKVLDDFVLGPGEDVSVPVDFTVGSGITAQHVTGTVLMSVHAPWPSANVHAGEAPVSASHASWFVAS